MNQGRNDTYPSTLEGAMASSGNDIRDPFIIKGARRPAPPFPPAPVDPEVALTGVVQDRLADIVRRQESVEESVSHIKHTLEGVFTVLLGNVPEYSEGGEGMNKRESVPESEGFSNRVGESQYRTLNDLRSIMTLLNTF